MQNFFTDHSHDAFGCMSNLLGESFDFAETKRKRVSVRFASLSVTPVVTPVVTVVFV